MNYLWDAAIRARQAGVPMRDISFIFDEQFGPYRELGFADINARDAGPVIPVNPYYRFYDIFKTMFDPDNGEDREVRDAVFDIAMHFLTEIDCRRGMCKKSFYRRFAAEDIARGALGEHSRNIFAGLPPAEKRIITDNVVTLYAGGDAIALFNDTLKNIFNTVVVYVNNEAADELLIFISGAAREADTATVTWITELFLPLGLRASVYWNEHVGIMGVDRTMAVGRTALY